MRSRKLLNQFINKTEFIIIALTLLFFAAFIFKPFISLSLLFILSFLYKDIINKILEPIALIFVAFFYSTLTPFEDWNYYIENFLNIKSFGLLAIFNQNFGKGLEFIYPTFMFIVGNITDFNPYALRFFTYLLIFSLLLYCLKPIEYRYKVALFYISSLSITCILTSSWYIRQVISILIFYVALEKRGTLKNLLFALSFFCHISSLANIITYYIYLLLKSKKHRLKLTISLVLAFSIFIFFSMDFLLSYIESRVNTHQNLESSSLSLSILLILLLNLLLITVTNYLTRQKGRFIPFLTIKEYLMILVTTPFPTIPIRLGMIGFGFPVLLLLDFFKKHKENKQKNIIIIIFALLNFIPTLYLLQMSSEGLNPLNFLNSNALNISFFEILHLNLNDI
ncbi:EpsG family protein [Comamonas kerstersii]|uniref:EpsG family protein n=1 Tax=Comamonas kerstersii TaxID=225992 RepID=UPI00266C304D|nr:EpsG family protein [Comamonas kerstersii]